MTTETNYTFSLTSEESIVIRLVDGRDVKTSNCNVSISRLTGDIEVKHRVSNTLYSAHYNGRHVVSYTLKLLDKGE